MLTFVRSLKVAHPAHELLVLEVDVVQVEAEVAFRESLKWISPCRFYNRLAK